MSLLLKIFSNSDGHSDNFLGREEGRAPGHDFEDVNEKLEFEDSGCNADKYVWAVKRLSCQFFSFCRDKERFLFSFPFSNVNQCAALKKGNVKTPPCRSYLSSLVTDDRSTSRLLRVWIIL